MKYSELGNTGIITSNICFGSLTMTPFQSNLTIKEGAYLIEHAFNNGINFIDTAQLYDNYNYIREALKGFSRNDLIISTKSYAWNRKLAEDALKEALNELNTDYIDIFLLHEQESELTIKGHYEALEFFMEAKNKGYIRALGLSTHRISGVLGANKYPELELIHPILNKDGLGIGDGNVTEMIKALEESKKLGKGIYSMKPLGGGHLIKDIEKSFKFLNKLKFIDSIAVGMQSIEEIDCNISLINNGVYPEELKEKLLSKRRKLIIEEYCTACGNCVQRCNQDALKILNGVSTVDYNKCVLCGYCATVCPDFYIKVV